MTRTVNHPHALVVAALSMAGVLMCLGAGAQSEILYVDDTMQVGVHQDKQLASTVIELIPSGTAVEVLARDGGLVQVRLADGRDGWVDSSFLIQTVPGRARSVALQAELDSARAQLAELQAQVAEMENQAANASEAENGNAAETIPSETLRDMQVLAEENQRLKQEIAELNAVQRMAVEKAETAQAELAKLKEKPVVQTRQQTGSGFNIAGWERWQQVLLASALLLAFAAGGWLVDWGTRRRHGGFRV